MTKKPRISILARNIVSVWNRGILARCGKRAWRCKTSLLNKWADQKQNTRTAAAIRVILSLRMPVGISSSAQKPPRLPESNCCRSERGRVLFRYQSLTWILRRITCVILRFCTKIFSACTDLRLLSFAFSRALSFALMWSNLDAI
jgi:hypothetical protein